MKAAAPSPGFTGFPIEALDFFEDLESDNTKSWWGEHKNIYDDCVRAPMVAFADGVAPTFGPAKIFRPYRDVRFAKDKTPYKTHQGAWFADTSRYVHLSAAGLMVAGGYWQTSTEQVARLRRAIADEVAGSALQRVLTAAARRRLVLDGEQLTRVPPGFEKDHPRADLLRHKTMTLSRELGAPGWLNTPAAMAKIVEMWRAMGPLIDWLDTHVGTH